MPSRGPLYIQRSLEPVLRRTVKEFPVLLLTGPRQSGKTTILRKLFETEAQYVSLEPPDVRAAAIADPRGFLDLHPPPVILDEIQRAPDLLSYVQEQVDAARSESGQWLLTGSQNLLLNEQVTQSLAGRAAVLSLLPLSRREVEGRPGSSLPWEMRRPTPRDPLDTPDLWRSFLHGGYPELVAQPRRDAARWYASYLQTYLERDVRDLRQIGDLTQFQIFVRLLAARSGSLLNLLDLSRDVGVAVNTAKAWLSVLEASWQIVVVRPWHANVSKRLVKTPKIYWTDVGVLCHLLGLSDGAHAAAGPAAGAIFETAVFGEILRTLVHRGEQPRIHFWRTSTGQEVDFLIERQGSLTPIEVKTSATPNARMAAGIHRLRADLGTSVGKGFVVHPGRIRLPLGDGVVAIPFTDL